MKTNQEIILAERAIDHGGIRAVLREWGYRESEIQRFLKEPRVDQKLEARRKTTDDQSGKTRIACRNSILCMRRGLVGP